MKVPSSLTRKIRPSLVLAPLIFKTVPSFVVSLPKTLNTSPLFVHVPPPPNPVHPSSTMYATDPLMVFELKEPTICVLLVTDNTSLVSVIVSAVPALISLVISKTPPLTAVLLLN